jgi:hypothetical protein
MFWLTFQLTSKLSLKGRKNIVASMTYTHLPLGRGYMTHFFLNWYREVESNWVQSALRPATVPATGNYDDGEIGGMIGRGNRSTRKKPTPVPLSPPKIPHVARTRTRPTAVGMPATNRLSYGAACAPYRSHICNRNSGHNNLKRLVKQKE